MSQPQKIYILSLPIHSGKTTMIQQWLRNNDSKASGILTPDKEGKRQLYDIARNEWHEFETNGSLPDEQVISIGKYRFSKQGFEKAREILLRSIEENFEWVIVDEVGKLELEDKIGLEPALNEVIKFYMNENTKGRLILVVRNYLLDEAIATYGLNKDMLVHQSFFE